MQKATFRVIEDGNLIFEQDLMTGAALPAITSLSGSRKVGDGPKIEVSVTFDPPLRLADDGEQDDDPARQPVEGVRPRLTIREITLDEAQNNYIGPRYVLCDADAPERVFFYAGMCGVPEGGDEWDWAADSLRHWQRRGYEVAPDSERS